MCAGAVFFSLMDGGKADRRGSGGVEGWVGGVGGGEEWRGGGHWRSGGVEDCRSEGVEEGGERYRLTKWDLPLTPRVK